MFVIHNLWSNDFKQQLEQIAQNKDSYALTDLLQNSLQFYLESSGQPTSKESENVFNDFLVTMSDSSLQADFNKFAWKVYPKFVRAVTLFQGGKKEFDPEYTTLGYKQGALTKCFTHRLIKSFKKAHVTYAFEEDYDLSYQHRMGFGHLETFYNTRYQFLLLEDEQFAVLKDILKSLQHEIGACLGTPWQVVNVRAFRFNSQVGESNFDIVEDFKKNCPDSVARLIISPKVCVNNNAESHGYWFLSASSSAYQDCAISQFVKDAMSEVIIEVTIMPALNDNQEPYCAGLNALWPDLPWLLPSKKDPLILTSDITQLELGGGRYFLSSPWINLDYNGLEHFPFTPNCRFPLVDESIPFVYTSHVLEHLNPPTILRVLSEVKRVLKKEGVFLIRVPDYDLALDHWRRSDISFFQQSVWCYPIETWSTRGVVDCVDYRAAMLFFGFANKEFGMPFGVVTPNAYGAYYGPPVVAPEYLHQIALENTPSQIVMKLREIVVNNEPTHYIVHQSAWSRQELKDLLEQFDFEVVSFDKDFIVDSYAHVYTINICKDYTMYCLARKK